MKNKYLLLFTLTFSGIAFSQVGINTEDPAATLDVVASPAVADRIDGLIAPRLKGSELKAKDALYTAAQDAAIVYVTEALPSAYVTDKTSNVTTIGYYYFDKTVGADGRWIKIANQQAAAALEPWNVQGTTTSSTSNTEAIYQNNMVAIKKQSGITGADLDVAGAIRGGGANTTNTVGVNSIAVGTNNIASNLDAAAFGGGNSANGISSFVGGKGNIVGTGLVNTSGYITTVFGENNKVNHILTLVNGYGNTLTDADGQAGTNFVSGVNNTIVGNSSWNGIIGSKNTISSFNVFAAGESNTLSASHTAALGRANKAIGQYSFVTGFTNEARATSSSAFGNGTIAYDPVELAVGRNNTIKGATATSERLLTVGNGVSSAAKSDAFMILKNAKVGVNIQNFEATKSDAQLQVNGSVKVGTSATCNADNEGTIRYDMPNKKFQGCDGTAWVNLN